MFSKTADPTSAPPATGALRTSNAKSVLAQDLRITGEITSSGSIEILGEVDGTIHARGLTVGPEGRVSGTVSAEVVDIRCLNPLDDETFIKSVMKTGRAMVVTEAVMTSGFAAELSARISERCFDYLEEPVVRVAGEDIPIPVSPALERGAVPSAQLIAETGLWLVKRIAPSWAA